MKRKIQVCKFKSGTSADWQYGLAFLNADFDECDVDFIVDMDGNKVIAVSDYMLSTAPLGAAIDVELCNR